MRSNNLFADKKKRYPITIAFLLGLGVFYLVQKSYQVWKQPKRDDTEAYNINRLKGYQNISPVIQVEASEKSPRFAHMREELKKLVDTLKMKGTIGEASVFFKEFDHGAWTSLNKDIPYHPASLMKVVLMLGYLQMAQNTPALFETKWKFEQSAGEQELPQFYNSKTIEPGRSYTVHELLLHMIAYSDNNATRMLASRLDQSVLKKLYGELGLKAPDNFDMNLVMTVREYSIFINAIYNASNLSPEYAEYAANLMANCDFKEGFFKGFPPNTRMWHKFGQWKGKDHDPELHESGVVYIQGKPYLITIMTRGKETAKLAEGMQAICKKIYREIPAP